MSNSFFNIKSDLYFLKLAPDFSIFDLCEKYIIENKYTNTDGAIEDKLFYFNDSKSPNIVTNFKRAMFKCSDNVSISNNQKFSYKKFEFPDYTIFICISTTDETISFELNENCRIIGVAF